MWAPGLCVAVDDILCQHAALPECVKGVAVHRGLGEVGAVTVGQQRGWRQKDRQGVKGSFWLKSQQCKQV